MAYRGAVLKKDGLSSWIKESCMQKIKVLTKEMREFYAFLADFETDRQTFWIIEMLYAIS